MFTCTKTTQGPYKMAVSFYQLVDPSDCSQTQAIADKITSGRAKWGNLDGKDVLVLKNLPTKEKVRAENVPPWAVLDKSENEDQVTWTLVMDENMYHPGKAVLVRFGEAKYGQPGVIHNCQQQTVHGMTSRPWMKSRAHCVFFFGICEHGWVKEKNIRPYQGWY